jgi:hypothetical protein
MSAKKIKGYLVDVSTKTKKIILTSYNTGRLVEVFDSKMQVDEFISKDRTFVKYAPSLGGDTSCDNKNKKKKAE